MAYGVHDDSFGPVPGCVVSRVINLHNEHGFVGNDLVIQLRWKW